MAYFHELEIFHKELKRIQAIPNIDTNHQLAARELSNIVKQGLLSYSDIIEKPEKFFSFHQAISEYIGLEGFGIRFTVQYNLFAGTIMCLGLRNHKQFLMESHVNGDLGCFMLTEYSSGVMSGMMCGTTAIMTNQKIILNTNDIVTNEDQTINFEKSLNRKNWISQGLYAKYAVVCAKLFINNQDAGIHPFFIRMNQSGIFIKSNGEKTVARSLDNCMIIFKNLEIPLESLMYPTNKLDELIKNPGIGFKRIAERLNSGRLCIALSMSSYIKTQFNSVKNDTFNKKIHTTKTNTQSLDTLPGIHCMLEINQTILKLVTEYVDKIASEYCQKVNEYYKDKTVNLDEDFLMTVLDNTFLEKIIIAKVLVINFGYKLMNDLKIRMGSNSLFYEKGMGTIDILLCARFAEGDNDILMDKLLADRMKKIKKISKLDYLLILKGTFIYRDMTFREKYLLISLIHHLMNKSNIHETNNLMKECKEVITYNIVKNYMSPKSRKLTISDIRSML